MSELTSSRRHGKLGRTLLWVSIALSVLLLGFVTALSIRTNPYYSDAEANGISKYIFIEECREQLAEARELETLRGVLQQTGQLRQGQNLHADIGAEPGEIVANTQAVPGGGWALSAPANISVEGQSSVLGQLGMQCTHDKAQNRTVAQIQLPGAQ
ncbi:hypothetical protein DAETH_30040 [Deinococcus aetherius]|uniref:Uncharacterized protein n=1 Tax=Deinococcus aetherius TaxID=200252 RepID=A0ABN6RJN2_9DEIO|nr:hypothetical protein [Deinococcus aetherius]BDP43035.1 hypothetical protein DAETH_30040 [Deinococcus aetherius]